MVDKKVKLYNFQGKELGAEAVVNPEDDDALKQLMDLTDGVGFERGVECAGVGAVSTQPQVRGAQRQATDHWRPT